MPFDAAAARRLFAWVDQSELKFAELFFEAAFKSRWYMHDVKWKYNENESGHIQIYQFLFQILPFCFRFRNFFRFCFR